MKFQVEAPIDLECGYPLEVDINGMLVAVTVPYDVKAGEIIPCKLLQLTTRELTTVLVLIFSALPTVEYEDCPPSEAPVLQLVSMTDNTHTTHNNLAPLRQWRYKLCDCCNLCCASGLWWNAYCLPCIVWGQLLTRLKLGPFANPRCSPECLDKTFFIVVGYVIFLWLVLILLGIIIAAKFDCHHGTEYYSGGYYLDYKVCEYTGNPFGIWIPLLVVGVSYFVYTLTMLTLLRRRFRHKYQIPGSCCEDCCCMYCCGCCNIIQMARHTHDEHVYKYQCCNKTGLPPDAPQVI
jgi:Cys-rich protein (TIGR01571 family)